MKTRTYNWIGIIFLSVSFSVYAAGPTKPNPHAPRKTMQPEAARAMFKRGFDAYVEFDCATALPFFRQGLQKTNDARAWYYVGNCERWRGEREASDAAYDNGLKYAESGSDTEARLTSAKASLPMAWNPRLQTEFFYDMAHKAGLDPPTAYTLSVDPRLFPVHPEYAFDLKINSSQLGPDPGQKRDGYRSYADIQGPGVQYRVLDLFYDRKYRKIIKGTKQRDASGWEFYRNISIFTKKIVGQPDRGWITGYIEHEQYSSTEVGAIEGFLTHRTDESRCRLYPASDDNGHSSQDSPVLFASCAVKLGRGVGIERDIYVDNSKIQIPWHLVSWKKIGDQ